MNKEKIKLKKELLNNLILDVEMFGPSGDDMKRICQLKKELRTLQQNK